MALTAQDLVLIQTVLDGTADLNSAEQGITILRQLDAAYFDDEDELIPDLAYDAFRLHVKALDPQNPYFSSIGADVRGGKIDLPHQLGSLNQVEVGGLNNWIEKIVNRLGVDVQHINFVVSAKLDGASALGAFDRQLKIAYSRGNGRQGADITRHVQHFAPKSTQLNGWVRAENIIAKKVFETDVQPKYTRSGGEKYKNPRNAVSGMMNASSHKDAGVYNHIDFVAYEVLGEFGIDKADQLDRLENAGFKIPQYIVLRGNQLTEQRLEAFINELRANYEYEVDGVVVDIDEAAYREQLESGELNPDYAFKYKVADTSNYAETEVIRVEWNLSKSGYFKPRVIVKPAILPGITWTYATGYNAKWIVDNGIGPGAIVGGQRMGDVVPNIIRVIKSVDPQMPEDAFVWNATNVDIVAANQDDHEEIWIQQLVHAVSKMDFPHLKEGGIRQVVEHLGTSSFDSTMKAILQMDASEWSDIIGANGKKIHQGIRDKMQGIEYHMFVGSMPHFGRGVGTRKMKKVFEVCKDLVGFKMMDIDDIISIDGFEETTADKIVGGLDDFFKFYNSLSMKPTFKVTQIEGAALNGQSVCVTGFRDKGLDAWIEANGGKVQSGVSGNTTILVAADPQSNSGKVKKANELNASGKANVEILSLAQFNQKFNR